MALPADREIRRIDMEGSDNRSNPCPASILALQPHLLHNTSQCSLAPGTAHAANRSGCGGASPLALWQASPAWPSASPPRPQASASCSHAYAPARCSPPARSPSPESRWSLLAWASSRRPATRTRRRYAPASQSLHTSAGRPVSTGGRRSQPHSQPRALRGRSHTVDVCLSKL